MPNGDRSHLINSHAYKSCRLKTTLKTLKVFFWETCISLHASVHQILLCRCFKTVDVTRTVSGKPLPSVLTLLMQSKKYQMLEFLQGPPEAGYRRQQRLLCLTIPIHVLVSELYPCLFLYLLFMTNLEGFKKTAVLFASELKFAHIPGNSKEILGTADVSPLCPHHMFWP